MGITGGNCVQFSENFDGNLMGTTSAIIAAFSETRLNSHFFFNIDDDILLVIHLNFLKTSDI